MREPPMQRKFNHLKSWRRRRRHRGQGRSLKRLFAVSGILLMSISSEFLMGCPGAVYHPANVPLEIRIKNWFSGPRHRKKGDYAYYFDGLAVAIDRGVYQETGSRKKFIIHWAVKNK